MKGTAREKVGGEEATKQLHVVVGLLRADDAAVSRALDLRAQKLGDSVIAKAGNLDARARAEVRIGSEYDSYVGQMFAKFCHHTIDFCILVLKLFEH